jgi:hypothetical protein
MNKRKERQMSPTGEKTETIDDSAAAGAAIYSKAVLSIYDLFVLGFSNSFVWKSPSRMIVEFYNEHVSGNHMDVGVGTGYFLDKCRFPTDIPTLALVDLNPNSLQTTAKRLGKYKPVTYTANILDPLEVELSDFDSIGLNYLLHCLPGNMLSKGVVFKNLKPHIRKRGVVFGTTILGQGVEQNALARLLMKIYNSRGIFSNSQDNLPDLKRILTENFEHYSIHVIGCVAYFTGRNQPR